MPETLDARHQVKLYCLSFVEVSVVKIVQPTKNKSTLHVDSHRAVQGQNRYIFTERMLFTAVVMALSGAAPAYAATNCSGASCTISGSTTQAVVIDAAGRNGSKGDNTVFGNPDGNAGGHGADRTIEFRPGSSINASALGAALRIDVGGGNGGDGGDRTFGSNGFGGNGGNAGSVTFKGELNVTNSNRWAASSAVRINASGGDAGKGHDVEDAPERNRAGHAGNVTMALSGTQNLKANGSLANALDIESRGGNAGASRHSTMQTRASTGNGAVGGNIEVSGMQGSFVTGGGDQAGAIRIRSMGGAGGVVEDGNYADRTRAAGHGASAGTVSLDIVSGSANPTQIQTIGSKSAGIEMLSQGGKGGQGGDMTLGNGVRGGHGGTGRIATLQMVNSFVSTSGDESAGIVIESRGGDGGKGGDSHAEIGKDGGAGGKGGDAGIVTVSITGESKIATQGTRSTGIQATSRGGDGGKGGHLWQAGVEGGVLAEGGAGSKGGKGGNVTLTSSATVTTQGKDSHGIHAASLSGAAGDGGHGIKGGAGAAPAVAGKVVLENSGVVSTQGESSHGVFAQNVGSIENAAVDVAVNLTNTATGIIATQGKQAYGLFAQSVGGSGGSGGTASGAGSRGGAGSVGGHGGKVQLTNKAAVATTGERASAIRVQSIGGNGGNGGSTAFLGGDLGLGTIGGQGGNGGDGGKVTVDHDGALSTKGDMATGLAVQSIGGGGGYSGTATAIALGLATYAIGGTGTGGGKGGNVDVTAAGDIHTTGNTANGIDVQSVGGGGGAGGDATSGLIGFFNMAIGGSSEAGGQGGKVVLTNSAAVTTEGTDSYGISAQSVGGGGGNGGKTTAVSISIPTKDISGTASVSLGGKGGAGGKGDDVTVKNRQVVSTGGDGARGIFVQSVGGGGGIGGSAFAKSIAIGAGTTVSASVALGGSGGKGGNGASATLTNESSVTTLGTKATALTAQSVGGGGGAGGIGSSSAEALGAKSYAVSVALGGKGGGGGDGGTAVLTNAGRVSTDGAFSRGIFAQSVGGGGGEGGGADADATANKLVTEITVGASGGDGGKGGTVTVVNNSGAFIATVGRSAEGIFAQSVGGGGGAGGVAGTATEEERTRFANTAAGKKIVETIQKKGTVTGKSAEIKLKLGGSGGKGGRGDDVEVTNDGGVWTEGDASTGLFAQSVGGGGGKGGAAKTKGTGGDISVTATIGGAGKVGGDGGVVRVTNRGDIITQGEMAYALQAQSVGGGGGSGGASESSAAGNKYTVTMNIGGSGGAGGQGNAVYVNNDGTLQTFGATAALIQSVGGGGGDGGASVGTSGIAKPKDKKDDKAADDKKADTTTVAAAPASTPAPAAGDTKTDGTAGGGAAAKKTSPTSVAVTMNLGGSGGAAGDGGNVMFTNNGAIVTHSNFAHGAIVQSIGGGGGTGGASQGTGEGGDVNVALAVGGSGGAAGAGGLVEIYNHGEINTLGVASYGVLAQSVGGGGGAAGNAQSGASGKISVGGSLARSGGAAGDGRSVRLFNDGNITTEGAWSAGVFAQSVGGGGGDGGAGSVDSEQTDKTKVSVNLGIGGGGGAAGNGDLVSIEQSGAGKIFTYGDDAEAIRAQSIGGGGGNGGAGTAKATVKKEEKKDDAKDAASKAADTKVADSKTGAAAKDGNTAAKDGANGDAAKTESTPSKSYVIDVAVGGSGGASGAGGDVRIIQSQDTVLSTQGDRSAGILAQSIGGGGGKGAVGSADAGYGDVAANVSLGGSGGKGSQGGFVHITDAGTISTLGAAAHGIHAQSIGGGGGIAAGASGQAGGKVKLALGAAVGGAGGSAADGGEIKIEHNGRIGTQGEAAYGLFAQSIGGGGGYATASTVGGEAKQQGSLVLGQAGGSGGVGNKVLIQQLANSQLFTSGWNSHAIFAQSVGGGGGVGGAAQSESKLNVKLGGAGNKGGRGGDVTVESSGAIHTTGAGAYGILAQSVGGGGGLGADSGALLLGKIPLTLDAGSGAEGLGGKVTVSAQGNITTEGDNAAAIFAQSVGGGGGVSANGIGATKPGISGSGSHGGDVDVTVNGSVIALGHQAPGIFAQSAGSAGGSRINVDIGSDSVVVGGKGEYGAAIILANGRNNSITVRQGAQVSALGGTAILAQGSATGNTVTNAGVLSGSVNLGSAYGNTVRNETGGVFNAGSVLELGRTGQFLNYGVFHAGNPGSYGNTRMTGDYKQYAGSADSTGGIYQSTVSFRDNQGDKLTVDGNAHLAGAVRVLGRYQLPTSQVRILDVTGEGHQLYTAAGLESLSPLVYDYKLLPSGNKSLDVKVDAHFDALNNELSPDEAQLASYLQKRWNQATTPESAELADVFDHFSNVQTIGDYRQTLSELANDLSQAPASQLPSKSLAFINLMMSCPEFQSTDASMREGNCYWGRVIGSHTKRSEDRESSGYSSNGITYQIGGQKAIGENWILGGSAAFEDYRLRGADYPVRTDGKSFNAGVVLKYQTGPWLFAGALNVGQGQYDTERSLVINNQRRTAESRWKAHHVATRLRGQYTYAQDNWYLKPLLDLDLAYQRVPGYNESGAGAFNLQMQSASRWNLTVTPALELGGRFDYKGATLRPYISVGASWMSDKSWKVKAGLQGDPSTDTFMLSRAAPKVTADVRTGLELINKNGIEVKAEYNVRFAKDYRNQTGILRMAVHF